jgi:hypothetical protein
MPAKYDAMTDEVVKKLMLVTTAVRATVGSPQLASWLEQQAKRERTEWRKIMKSGGIDTPEELEVGEEAAWKRVAELEHELRRIAAMTMEESVGAPAVAAQAMRALGKPTGDTVLPSPPAPATGRRYE